jgi:predicted transcriptional regulator
MSSKQAAHRATVGKLYSNILQNIGRIKTPMQLERHVKGIANHWRISILLLVQKRGGLTLEQLATTLGGNAKTISVHTQKLTQAGLINKKYQGTSVIHTLTPYGAIFCSFLKSF